MHSQLRIIRVKPDVTPGVYSSRQSDSAEQLSSSIPALPEQHWENTYCESKYSVVSTENRKMTHKEREFQNIHQLQKTMSISKHLFFLI